MLRVFSVILWLGIGSTAYAATTSAPTTTPTMTNPALSLTLSPTIPIHTATTNPVTTPAIKTAENAAENTPLDTKTLDRIIGVKGRMDTQTNTYRIVVPRTDLNIVVNGVKLSPAMGLTSWAAFKKTQNITTLKADIVVTENQANTILSLALDNNLAVIALHNHLLWESPRVMFIHVEGVGDEKTLAESIKKVLAKTLDTEDEASDFPLAAIDASDTTLNPTTINTILGAKGAVRDGSYHIQVSKASIADKKTDKDKIINTTATFAGSDEEAVIDGDLSLRAADLHSVLESLHKAGIAIVALHQHESNNAETRMVYLHYFGVGSTKTLAKGLRVALEAAKTNDTVNETAIALMKNPPPANAKPATTTASKPDSTTVAPIANVKTPVKPVALVKTPVATSLKAANSVSLNKTATKPAMMATIVKATVPIVAVKTAKPLALVKTPAPAVKARPKSSFVTPAYIALAKPVTLVKGHEVAMVKLPGSTADMKETTKNKTVNTVAKPTTVARAKNAEKAKTVTVAQAKPAKPAALAQAKPVMKVKPAVVAQAKLAEKIKPTTVAQAKPTATKSAEKTKPVTVAKTRPVEKAKSAVVAQTKTKTPTNAKQATSTVAQAKTSVLTDKQKAAAVIALMNTPMDGEVKKATNVSKHNATSVAQTRTTTTTTTTTTPRTVAMSRKSPRMPQVRSLSDSKRFAEESAAIAAKRQQS